MEARITVVGNLTVDAEKREKGNNSFYHILRIAANKNMKETKFYTCFCYGISDERAKLLKSGSLIYIYGVPNETTEINPNSGDQVISRIINVIDLQIVFTKN